MGGIVRALLVALEEATLEATGRAAVAIPARPTRAARAALRLQAELKLAEVRDAPLTFQQVASTKEVLVLVQVAREAEGGFTGAELGLLPPAAVRVLSAPTVQ